MPSEPKVGELDELSNPWEPVIFETAWYWWPWRLIKFVLAIALVPVKVILLLATIILLYLVVKLTLLISCATPPTEPGDPPLNCCISAFFRLQVQCFCRFVLFLLGFWWISITDLRAGQSDDDAEPAQLIISNHIGYVDILCLEYLFAPSFVAKHKVMSAPLIGPLAIALQTLFVKRDDPNSRFKVKQCIDQRASDTDFPPLAIFPEGTTTTGSHVIKLQKGAFYPGKPIQPIAFRIPSACFQPIVWSKTSILRHLGGMLSQVYNRIHLVILPVYYPSDKEKDDPKQFAKNLQKIMARAARMPYSNKSLYDCPHLHFAPKEDSNNQIANDNDATTAQEVQLQDQKGQTKRNEKGGVVDNETYLDITNPPDYDGRKSILERDMEEKMSLIDQGAIELDGDEADSNIMINVYPTASVDQSDAKKLGPVHKLHRSATTFKEDDDINDDNHWSRKPRLKRALSMKEARQATKEFWDHRSSIFGMIAP